MFIALVKSRDFRLKVGPKLCPAANKQGRSGENAVTGGSLGCRDCSMTEFSIQRKARGVRTLEFRRTSFGLLRDFVGKLKKHPALPED